jgi:hypothetical protein
MFPIPPGVTAEVNLTPCPKCGGKPKLGGHGVGHSAEVTHLPPRPMTERQLQTAVLDLCRWLHLLAYHTHNSQHSARGFPDLVIVGPRGLLFAELKTAHGRTTIDQRCWEAGIREAGASYALWRPEHWHSGEIRETLAALCARITDTPAARPRARAPYTPPGTGHAD